MDASRRPRLEFIKSMQPTPEAAMSRLARVRRKQRLLLHERKLVEIAKQLARSSPSAYYRCQQSHIG